jgi:Glycosyl transferase family 90
MLVLGVGVNVSPWNPLSEEAPFPQDEKDHRYTDPGPTDQPPGFIDHFVQLRLKDHVAYASKYKYLIVLTGSSGFATADRLALFLAHTSAVVMLQESEFSYHFSTRLKPWVHYVPLTYSASDIVEKVPRWSGIVFRPVKYTADTASIPMCV